MRVFLDPGHGGVDTGATFHGLVEKDIVLAIALKAATELENRGHLVRMSRRTDFQCELSRRCKEANEWLADIFLSLHLNADPDPDEPGMPEAHGSEFWIYPGSVEGGRLAKHLAEMVHQACLDEPARGIKEGKFYVLKHSLMPAVLLELAFIDTKVSQRLLVPDLQLSLATGIAMGVDNYEKSNEPGTIGQE